VKPLKEGSEPLLLGRVERANIGYQLLSQLRQAIVEGRLAPGQTLTQKKLAEGYKVSRQPVRQALEVLASEGLTVRLANGGAMVAPLELDFVRDLYEVRAQLEVLAIERASTSITKAELAQLMRLIQGAKQSLERKDVAKLIGLDQRFHQLIYKASGNRVLQETLERYWSQLGRVMRAVLLIPEYPPEVWHQHVGILNALKDHDNKRAAKLMKDHIISAMQLLLNLPLQLR
jgi:DNA-binding GntR family transcriptional regulator